MLMDSQSAHLKVRGIAGRDQDDRTADAVICGLALLQSWKGTAPEGSDKQAWMLRHHFAGTRQHNP
jgi:hypothetical protein